MRSGVQLFFSAFFKFILHSHTQIFGVNAKA